MSTARTGIVGAGVSGLSLALLLDGEFEIFETADDVGGHAASVVEEGWTFDRGPHIMFSRRADVLDFMIRSLRGNVHASRRNSKVCIDGHFAKYPIENDLAALPTELRNRCLLDFLFNEHADPGTEPRNLHEWFLKTFGAGLTDAYFVPYNEKVWKVPIADLSMSWAERIPQPPPIDVVRGALGIETEGYVHQLHFHYPRCGGYQAIPRAFAQLLPAARIRCSAAVERIVPGPDSLGVVTGGVEHSFDRVVSTVPLPILLGLLPDVPDRVRDAADALRVHPMLVVSLGFRGVDPHQFSSVYFPADDFLVNRISSPCTFSPENGPPGCYSVQAEITSTPGGPELAMTDGSVVEHVVDGLRRNRVLRADEEPIYSRVDRYQYAYVVYERGYEERFDLVRRWLEGQGIHPHGRFGAFEYLNVDGCVIRSIELAERLNRRPTAITDVDVPDQEESGTVAQSVR
ncbi:MAG TPA: FAD-dependent oxidoreductase [Acidimicrobiia bacterium]|nr:FAD-dependent oxidoreductase [Acidimicrobiia bacterium]